MTQEILTFTQACELLGYKKGYVYQLMHYKKIPYLKPNNGKVFFERVVLEAWLKNKAVITADEAKIFAATYVTTHK